VQVYLNIAQIIVSVSLIVIIIFQARSSSAGSMFGGSDSSVYRTRRGVERTLYWRCSTCWRPANVARSNSRRGRVRPGCAFNQGVLWPSGCNTPLVSLD
jgi:preprotein translocase subunit SecG